MSEMAEYFTQHARLSRRTLARFAETELERIDQAADDLGFGPLLRLDEAEEILAELDREEDDEQAAAASEDDEDDGDPNDDDEDDDQDEGHDPEEDA